MRSLAISTILLLLFSGCVSTPRNANPLKSQGAIKILEKPNGKFILTVKDNGDGTFVSRVEYTGESAYPGEFGGTEPWKLVITKDSEPESPALMRSFDSLDKAIAVVPELGALLAQGMPAEPVAQESWLKKLAPLLLKAFTAGVL